MDLDRPRPHMIPHLKLIPSLAVSLPLVVGAGTNLDPAVAAKEEQEQALTFSLDARLRGEWRENNFDFDSSVDALTDDSWLLSRLRLAVDWQASSWFCFYVQGQDAREFFSDRPNVPGQLGAEGDDAFDLHQAFFDLGNPSRGYARIGRQELDYGDGRLISRTPWKNITQTFDALKLHYAGAQWWVDLFTSSVVRVRDGEFNRSDWLDDSDERNAFFSGLYFSTTVLDVQVTDFYALQLHEDDKGGSDFVTLGTRVKADPAKLAGWDYETEMAVQFGTRFGKDLEAFAGHWGFGWNGLRLPWKPRLGFEYSFATGDSDATDGEVGTFQNLFPTNHPFYGLMDVFAWQNIHNPAVKFSLGPSPKLRFSLDYHLFWLADTNDGWYPANQTSLVRPISPDASSRAGSELDFTVLWKATDKLDVQAGYSRFFAGSYLDDTGASDDADFAYLMASFKF